LSSSAIREELLRFGRRRAVENENLAPLIDELISRRNDASRKAALTDACYLAHSTGLFSRCVELFQSCARHSSLDLQLHECVVDSCFELGADFLPRLFDLTELMAVRIKRDPCSQLAVLRAFWLCCVGLVEAEQGLASRYETDTSNVAGPGRTKTRGAKPKNIAQPSEYRAACERLHGILHAALHDSANIATPNFPSAEPPASRGHRSSSGVVKRAILDDQLPREHPFERIAIFSSEAASHVRDPSDNKDRDRPLPPLQEMMRATLQCVRYSTRADNGEAAFYRHAIFRPFVQGRHERWMGTGVTARAAIFVSLIRSTQRGAHVAVAREYVAFFRIIWSEHDVGPGGNEHVLHAYFQMLANTRSFEDILAEASELLKGTSFPVKISSPPSSSPSSQRFAYSPSNSIVALVIRAAGELRRLDMCLWCVDQLLGLQQQPQVQQRSAPTAGGPAPSPYEMFICLVALAKCSAPNFFQILEACQSAELVRLSEEEVLYVRLQYVRNSIDAKERIDVLSSALCVETSGSDREVATLSRRNKNLVLHILQSCDSDHFLTVLMAFCRQQQVLGETADRSWGPLALAWMASRRMTRSGAQDRRFVRSLLEDLDMVDPASPGAEPYRHNLLAFLALEDDSAEPASSLAFRPFTRRRGDCLSFLAGRDQPPVTVTDVLARREADLTMRELQASMSFSDRMGQATEVVTQTVTLSQKCSLETSSDIKSREEDSWRSETKTRGDNAVQIAGEFVAQILVRNELKAKQRDFHMK
jgi:hypothetical protein